MVLSDISFLTAPLSDFGGGSRLVTESSPGALTRLHGLHLRDTSQLAELQNLLRRRRGKQMQGPGDDSGPSGLVAGAEPGPVVAVEVFVEEQ